MARNREEPLVLVRAVLGRFTDRRALVIDLPEPEAAAHLMDEMGASDVHWLHTRWDRHRSMPDSLDHGFAVVPDPSLAPRDVVLLFLPHGKARLRELSATAAQVLAPDGELLVVGGNGAGIRSAPRVLEEAFEHVSRLESARHCQLHRATGPRPDAAPPEPVHHELTVAGVDLHVITRPGVFSADGLDEGTRLLLENLSLPEEGRVVDVGCGAGVIGAFIGRRAPDIELLCCDVDAAALAASEATLQANGVAATVLASDVLADIDGRIDLVVSNPPFHQGVRTEYGVGERLVRESAARLHKRGRIILVCNRFLRYNQWLEESFQRVECLADDGRYQVWVGAEPRLRR